MKVLLHLLILLSILASLTSQAEENFVSPMAADHRHCHEYDVLSIRQEARAAGVPFESHFFYACSAADTSLLDGYPNLFVRSGANFLPDPAWPFMKKEMVIPVHRFFFAKVGKQGPTHFFTSNPREFDLLMDWQANPSKYDATGFKPVYEGISYQAYLRKSDGSCPSAAEIGLTSPGNNWTLVPLLRAFNNGHLRSTSHYTLPSNHYFGTDRQKLNDLVSKGWTEEPTGLCVREMKPLTPAEIACAKTGPFRGLIATTPVDYDETGEDKAVPYCATIYPMGVYVGQKPVIDGRVASALIPFSANRDLDGGLSACKPVSGKCFRQEAEAGRIVFVRSGVRGGDIIHPVYYTYITAFGTHSWVTSTPILQSTGLLPWGKTTGYWGVSNNGREYIVTYRGLPQGFEIYEQENKRCIINKFYDENWYTTERYPGCVRSP